MFVVIAAIGSCGVYALVLNQQTADVSTRGDDRTSEARRMASVLDREQAQLLPQAPSQDAARLQHFAEANALFAAALADFERDATPNEASFVKALRPQHEAYVRTGHKVMKALLQDQDRLAASIEMNVARPQLTLLRDTLDAVSTESFAGSAHDDAVARQATLGLERLIAAITFFALVLMSGIAFLLARYQRTAAKAAAATLAALQEAALTDNLTNLGNHRAFSDDFAREVARAKRNHHSLALALIDIDDFKAVNDTRGHAHGDDVLVAVGSVLRTLRREDRAYRVGGDEFALLLVETDAAAAALVLTRLKQAASAALSGATLSIGYANLSAQQLEMEPYELADTALYEAKRRGRNVIVCFDEISDSVDVFSPRKAEAVRRLIAEERLSVAFQPIWDIDSTRPLAFEALARPDAEFDLSGPQEAFDIAERIRQVFELDSLCIRKALEAVSNLPSDATIFLNVSPASLSHANFDPHAFVVQLRAAGVDPHHVVIELTERRIDDQTGIIQRSQALRALGVRMALDDTGSGHAGLEILSKLRLDFVKIDRALLVKAIYDQGARGVLAGIIAIARETGSYLIAEGIESRELLDFVCTAHESTARMSGRIRGVQGYLLGRPELGRVNTRALEESHAYLMTMNHENANAGAPKAA